jgi:uncharacterized protein YggU (UPF0235/DUF167 family)
MTEALAITATTGGVRLGVRVVPRSPRTAIEGVRAGRLLIRVTAPPVDRAANEAVIAALAAALALPRRSLSIVSGATGRNKTIDIAGLTEAQVLARVFPSSQAKP